jgi:hypothetical protein
MNIEQRIARILEREFDPVGSRLQFATIANILVNELELSTERLESDRQVALGQPYTVGAEQSWNKLVQIVEDELGDGLHRQCGPAETLFYRRSGETNINLQHLAARIINELISLT